MSSRIMKMSYSLVIAKDNLRKILKTVVQDYRKKRLTFKNLSFSSIGQLRFLKYYMFEWFDLSMRVKTKTTLGGKVFVSLSYIFSFSESYYHNIFFFFSNSILKRSPSQFFSDFKPSVFVVITGLILNLKMRFQPN